MGLTQTVAPLIEPVSLAEAKLHLRVEEAVTEEDALITTLIEAAREDVESFTGRQLCVATWAYTLDAFPARMKLPRPPLISVSSIQYVDSNGETQTVSTDDYVVYTNTEPGRIGLAYNATWPTTRRIPDAVTVTYLAGYDPGGSSASDDADEVPARAKAAIKLLVADMFEHREARLEAKVEDNPAIARLLWPLRMLEL